VHVAVDHENVELLLGGPAGGKEEVVVGGQVVPLTAGETVRVSRLGSRAEDGSA